MYQQNLLVQIDPPGNLVDLIALVGDAEIVTEINGDVSRPDAFGKNEFDGFGLRLIGLYAGVADVDDFSHCA